MAPPQPLAERGSRERWSRPSCWPSEAAGSGGPAPAAGRARQQGAVAPPQLLAERGSRERWLHSSRWPSEAAGSGGSAPAASRARQQGAVAPPQLLAERGSRERWPRPSCWPSEAAGSGGPAPAAGADRTPPTPYTPGAPGSSATCTVCQSRSAWGRRPSGIRCGRPAGRSWCSGGCCRCAPVAPAELKHRQAPQVSDGPRHTAAVSRRDSRVTIHTNPPPPPIYTATHSPAQTRTAPPPTHTH